MVEKAHRQKMHHALTPKPSIPVVEKENYFKATGHQLEIAYVVRKVQDGSAFLK